MHHTELFCNRNVHIWESTFKQVAVIRLKTGHQDISLSIGRQGDMHNPR